MLIRLTVLAGKNTKTTQFVRASIWLLHGRNFQKYDTRGIGIISEDELVKAMEVFLKDQWKYEGVLW